MQNKFLKYLLIALATALILLSYKTIEYKLLVNDLIKENKSLHGDRARMLEEENRLLKDQVYRLESQQSLFKANQQDYEVEENLNFEKPTDLNSVEEENIDQDDDEIKITPSIEIDKDKRQIDGVKLQIETKF